MDYGLDYGLDYQSLGGKQHQPLASIVCEDFMKPVPNQGLDSLNGPERRRRIEDCVASFIPRVSGVRCGGFAIKKRR